MHPRFLHHVTAIAASSMILTLAACGSDQPTTSETKAPVTTESPDTTPPVTEPVETDPPATEPPATTPVETDPPATLPTVTEPADTEPPSTEPTSNTFSPEDIAAGLQTLMLTPEDLDPSFVEQPADTTSSPTPCGVDIDAEVPYIAIARTSLVSESLQLLVTQAIRAYDSADTALTAAQTAAEGLSCGGDETITIGEITDVSSDVGTDAFAVTVSNADSEGVIVVAVVTDSIITLQFVGATGAAEAAGAPNPVDIAAFAVERVLDYLNG